MAKINKGARGWANSPDDRKYTPKRDSNPWQASASGEGYNARFNDDRGFARVADLTWDDKNTAAFLKPSNTSDDGDKGATDIFSEVVADQGEGAFGEGAGPVREIKRRGK